MLDSDGWDVVFNRRKQTASGYRQLVPHNPVYDFIVV